MAGSGLDFAAIASNTPHIVFDRVQKQSSLPLMIRDGDIDTMILNATQIDVDAIVNYI